ncbi:MAG: YqeG family HAD IIIA-type phosphatase [Clostridia bacterium]|nr:YqeG family HAD IIIA-type phosphatase [Clostridia bacterium]
MLRKFYPDAYASDVFSIDYQKLYDMGYKALLFDIDNTLVPHNRDITAEVEELFKNLYAIGFKTVLVSNNSQARVEGFSKNIECPYVYEAGKPNITAYIKALNLLEISTKESVFIGDQMFIDIYGANKAGLKSIMVHFIVVNDKEKIGVRRHLENFILFFYRMKKSAHKLNDAIIKR